jgi:hypothetical protein
MLKISVKIMLALLLGLSVAFPAKSQGFSADFQVAQNDASPSSQESNPPESPPAASEGPSPSPTGNLDRNRPRGENPSEPLGWAPNSENWFWYLGFLALSVSTAFWVLNKMLNKKGRPSAQRRSSSQHKTAVQGFDDDRLRQQIADQQQQIDFLRRTVQTLERKINSFDEIRNQPVGGRSSGAPSAYPTAPQSSYQEPAIPSFPYQAPAYSSPAERVTTTYTQNPNHYERLAIKVSETNESLERRRRNSTVPEVTLAENSNPNYWIVTEDSTTYWLVPKTDFRVSGASFGTLQALFNIQGQQSNRWKLLKPAAVQLSHMQEWELIHKGEIQFL